MPSSQLLLSPAILAFGLGLLSTSTLAQNTANVSWEATPYVFPATPLVVKSPYLPAWARGTDGIAGQWPHFATGGILGSTCYVKIDNTTYTVWGNPGTKANATARQTYIHASRTVPTQPYIAFTAGPVNLYLGFYHSLDYANFSRLSLPFSYITVRTFMNETDTTEHAISVYLDVGGEWLTGDSEQLVKWSTEADDNTIIHKMNLQDPVVYAESCQRAQWGALYFASNQTRYSNTQADGTTWQTGQDTVVRQQFLSTGKLANTQDTGFRKVSENWPVMALAQDLGNVSRGFARRATFMLGHLRDPVVQYQTPISLENSSLYFTSELLTYNGSEAVKFAFNDWEPAVNVSTNFGAKITIEGEDISPDYMGVLSASTLQAFASMELTVPNATKSSRDTRLFIKDAAIEEDGSSKPGVFSSVNSLYSIMPMLIYTNPWLGNYGLKPLLEYGRFFNQPFAAHDIGKHYGEPVARPNQRGTPVDCMRNGLFLCGCTTASMIIMTYAFIRYTGDVELAAVHYDTLKIWADYLVENALFHPPQVTGDWFVGDAAGPAGNMTNVALKGLIALRSMLEIQNSIIDKSSESPRYLSAANWELEQWIQLSDYGTKFTYQSSAEHSKTKQYLLHALYADRLLGLNFVPESVYDRQTTQFKSGRIRYGVPITDANNFTTLAHQYFTIAALNASSPGFLGNSAFTPTKNYTEAPINGNLTALADTYDTVTGVGVAGSVARGSVGGVYAVLALQKGEVKPISPIMAPSPNSAGTIITTSLLFVLVVLISWALLV